MIVDAAVNMIRKMKKKPLPCVILECSFAAMLCVNAFSLKFSSVSLMLLAGAVSLTVFLIQNTSSGKGGEKP